MRDIFLHQGKGFTPDGCIGEITPDEVAAKNRETSAQEVKQFIDNPPLKYFAYVNMKTRKLTTWIGDVLGDIQFGCEYKTPAFGWPSTRVAIRVKAINNQWYSGTYYKSSGDYARITLTARKGW